MDKIVFYAGVVSRLFLFIKVKKVSSIAFL